MRGCHCERSEAISEGDATLTRLLRRFAPRNDPQNPPDGLLVKAEVGVERLLFCRELASRLFLRERRKAARRCAILSERNVRMEKKRILVADDDTPTREMVAKLLQDEGYDIALATDGQEAITLVSTYCPDLVLTDLSMPRLNGLAVLTH